MKHLKIAGAPAAAGAPGIPGTGGFTINDLPDDMIINIFSMMDIESLLVVSKVCARWQQLCETPYVWKYACLDVDYFNCKGIIKNILPIVGKFLKKVKISFQFAELRASLIRNCTNLTHLEITLETRFLFSSILDDLRHWPNLKFLSFDVINTTEPDRNYSGYYPPFVAKNLTTLKLRLRYTQTVANFRASLIRSCPNLTRLEISESQLDISVFYDLHLLPNLKFLSFYYSSFHGANRDSAYNLPFEKLKYLETLTLSHFKLTRKSLYSMLECENLVSININHIENIPADFLESLVRAKQPTLRELRIYGDTLNDDIMRLISNCRVLQA